MTTEPRTYDLVRNAQGDDGIACRFCGFTSWSAKDVQERFCGHCHLFLGDIMWMIDIGGTVGKYKELREINGIDLQRMFDAKKRPPPSRLQRIGSYLGRLGHRVWRLFSRR